MDHPTDPSQEMPETCPECGKDNANENGDWIFPQEPPFCSYECRCKWYGEWAYYDEPYEDEEAACPNCGKILGPCDGYLCSKKCAKTWLTTKKDFDIT